MTLQQLRDIVEGTYGESDSDESDSDESDSDDSSSGESDDEDTTSGADGCQFVAYEENECGRREWCEESCVKAGGLWEGPYETDRQTMKTSCTTWDENWAEDTYCDFRKTDFMGGDMGCDLECQPFGGVWDPNGGSGMGSCDWGVDFVFCPEGWTRMASRYIGNDEYEDVLICDVDCLGTGGEFVTVEEEWGEY